MNIDTKVLWELEELAEAARLLGVTQARRGFGCYTDEDRRFERAMRESVAKHRAALCELLVGVEGLRADRGSREQTAHPATTHCDNCGRDWLDNGLNPAGCPYCKQHAQAAEIRALWAERDALLDALRRIAEWPDGGNRYGQENIKRFARHTIDAALAQEDHNGQPNAPCRGCI